MHNRVFTAARDAVSPEEVTEDEMVFRLNGVLHAKTIIRAVLPVVLSCMALSFIDDLIRKSLSYALFWLAILSGIYSLFLTIVFLHSALVRAPKFSVRVSEKGISGFSFWGKKTMLSWGEIETVENSRIFGIAQLKITSFRKDRRAIWLPLVLKSPEGFRAAVAHHASPNNPLRRYLEDELGREREPLRG